MIKREAIVPESPWGDRIASALIAIAAVSVFLAGYARGVSSVDRRPLGYMNGSTMPYGGSPTKFRDVTITDGATPVMTLVIGHGTASSPLTLRDSAITDSVISINGNATLEDDSADSINLGTLHSEWDGCTLAPSTRSSTGFRFAIGRYDCPPGSVPNPHVDMLTVVGGPFKDDIGWREYRDVVLAGPEWKCTRTAGNWKCHHGAAR